MPENDKTPWISDGQIDQLLEFRSAEVGPDFTERVFAKIGADRARRSKRRRTFLQVSGLAAVLALGAIPFGVQTLLQTDRELAQFDAAAMIAMDPTVAELVVWEERFEDALALISDGMLLVMADEN